MHQTLLTFCDEIPNGTSLREEKACFREIWVHHDGEVIEAGACGGDSSTLESSVTFKSLNLVPSTSQAYVAPQAEDSVFENRSLVRTFQNQTIAGASTAEKRPTYVRVL